jgi:glycosyltransferase involved in cell wall biosynthesis
MKNFRVVHLASAHSPFDVRIFHKECKSLAKAGYEITVIAPHDRVEIVDGIYIRGVPKFTSRLGRLFCSMWHVCYEAIQQNADVYHFHDLELIPLGLFLRALGKKVVYDIHEDYPCRGIFSKPCILGCCRQTLGRLLEPAENFAARHFSALVPATPAIGSRFTRLGNKTAVVQNFPRVTEFASIGSVSWNQRASAVAYIGHMSIIRGTKEIVKAIDLLPERLNATLKLAGTFFPADLRQELACLSGWQRVETVDFLSHQKIPQMLMTVRAGLVTLHPEIHHLNSQPTKLFEYMAAGIPVIASDFPLWREIIHRYRCGLVVDPLSPNAIAEAIEYILTHAEEAEEMGLRGRKAVEACYNWDNEERELLQLYSELAG